MNDFTLANQESLDELAWAMEACQGQFCLMLARCNYGYLQQRLIQQLQEECTFNIRVIHLKPEDRTLFSTVRSQLGQEIPSALMVSGFAALDNLDDMFAAMNQVREEFRKNFPFPFILWMNDRVYIRLLRIAPDFESWATTTAAHRQEASAKTDNQETVAPEIIASGRQRDLERLLERIGRNDCKLIVIHGLSGVGKSSLVNAGLMPALKHRVIGIQNNLPLLIRVYTNWVEELNKQLVTDFVRDELEEEKRTNNPVGAGLDDNISIKPQTSKQNPSDSSVGAGLGDNLSRKPQTSKQNPPSPSQDLDNNFSRKPQTSKQNPPYAKILEQLRQNEQHNIRTVLIFDQFEEFFFVYPNLAQRRPFWDFLGDCLNILSVKVILSLREDYLHYLLECNRLDSMSVIGHDILGKNVLYGLGNFSPADARSIIEDLTTRSHFYLEPALIDQLVKDLAGQTGEILPIELQIVGAQLQAENIKSLADYREVGTKEELVKHYVEAVIEDCGIENRQAAELALYLLTDEKGTRPLKTRAELERDLKEFVDDLTTDASKLEWKLESLDNLIVRGCNWLRDYLKTNPNVSESDRKLCEGVERSGK